MKNKIINVLKKIVHSPLFYALIISTLFQKFFYNFFEKYTIYPDTSSYIKASAKNIFLGEVHKARTPIFPYFCKLVSIIGGKNHLYTNVVLVQKILFFVSIIFFYLTIKKLTKNKIINFIGTLIYSSTPFLFMWNTVILTESISIFEAVILFYLTVSYIKKESKISASLIGVQLLIMIMTRPANIYLVAPYLLFWFLKLFGDKTKEERKIVFYGLGSTVVAIICILLYCNQIRLQYGEFGLSAVKNTNSIITLIDSRLYYYGEDEKIIKDIDKIIKPGDESTIWKAYYSIAKKYKSKKLDEFNKRSIRNAKKKYVNYIAEKVLTVGQNNIGTIYSMREKNKPKRNLENLSIMLFPISFDLLFVILSISFIYLIYYLIKGKAIEWTVAALFSIIAGNVFISIIAAPYETQRLCVISIPATILLIAYLISIICKTNISDYSKQNKKRRKKKNLSNIGELIYYIETIDINELFRKKTDNTFIQFFRYIFVGGIAAVVNVGMLYVFTDIFNFFYVISNVLSFILGLIVNYLLSKKFVFQEETSISQTKEFVIYAIIGVIGLGIDTLLVWVFTEFICLYYMISKIISTLIVFIWNFGARKVLYKIIK